MFLNWCGYEQSSHKNSHSDFDVKIHFIFLEQWASWVHLRSCHTVFQTAIPLCIPASDVQECTTQFFHQLLVVSEAFVFLVHFYLGASQSQHISSLCPLKPKGMMQTGPCGSYMSKRFRTQLKTARFQTHHSFTVSCKQTHLSLAPQEVLSLLSETVNKSALFQRRNTIATSPAAYYAITLKKDGLKQKLCSQGILELEHNP